MKKGDEVYFFDSKRELDSGVIVGNRLGIYTINNGKRNYQRKLSQIGRKKNGTRKNKTDTARMEK